MNILETIATKANEIGTEKLLESLGVDMPTYSGWFYKGKRFKAPSFDICQKVLDLWSPKDAEPQPSDIPNPLALPVNGSLMTEDGEAVNMVLDQPKEKASWEGRDVCLCLPIYDQVSYEFFFSVSSLIMKYRDQMWLNTRGSDSMIARSRNHLAKRFLDTGASWSIWFDSDMVFPMGHAGIYSKLTGMKNVSSEVLGVHAIDRLISWKKTVVGGCYWDRRGSGKLIAGSRQPILHSIPKNTLQAVDFVGTGCLAVHRQVFLDIAAKFPETMSADSLGNECGFFTPINTPHRMLGEDEAFAKRATDSGHPSYLDLGLICGHIGRNVHALPVNGSKI